MRRGWVGAVVLTLAGCSSPGDTPASDRSPPPSKPVSVSPEQRRAVCMDRAQALPEFSAVARTLCAELHSLDAVSASVALAVDGEVVFAFAHGPRCIGRPEPLTPSTALRIGSITKLVTAATVLRIAQDNGITLDHAVPSEVVALDEPATLQQLLTHTSGLRDRDESVRMRLGSRWREGIEAGRRVPGEHHYANVNFIVLGAWVEHAMGRSFAEVVAHDPVLRPMAALLEFTAKGDARGCGHRKTWGWTAADLNDEPELPAWTQAAGGAIASVEDLARLPAALAKTGQLEQMFQTHVPTSDPSVRYGLGVRIFNFEGETVLAHAGATRGHWAEVQWSPGRNVAVAVLSSTPQPFKATLFASFEAVIGRGDSASGRGGASPGRATGIPDASGP